MIKSVNKAIEILEILKKHPEGCSLYDVYTSLGIPKSTAYGILKTLVDKIYVLKDRNSIYKLGPALIFLGKVASKEINIKKIALPIMEEVSAKIKVESFLMIPLGYKGTVLERVEGEESVKIIERFGNEFFLHCGATRKAILANKSEKFIEMYLKEVIDNKENNIDISSKHLREKLKEIKKEGVAVSYGEYAKGTVGIGAPIFNNFGEVIASLGINLLENESLTQKRIEELKIIIKTKACKISKNMGYLSSI